MSFQALGDGFPAQAGGETPPLYCLGIPWYKVSSFCVIPSWQRQRGNLLESGFVFYEIATPLAGLAMTQRLPFRGAGTASAVTEGLTPPGKIKRFCPPPLKGRRLRGCKNGARGLNLLPHWGFNRIENQLTIKPFPRLWG